MFECPKWMNAITSSLATVVPPRFNPFAAGGGAAVPAAVAPGAAAAPATGALVPPLPAAGVPVALVPLLPAAGGEPGEPPARPKAPVPAGCCVVGGSVLAVPALPIIVPLVPPDGAGPKSLLASTF